MHTRSVLKAISVTLFACLALATHSARAETTIVGSSALEPFLKEWAAMAKAKAGLDIAISSPGTSVAPKALVQDRADIGAMNREMTNDEAEAFIRTHGYYPTGIVVAIEAIAIYVNPENPVNGLEFDQLDAIYSGSHGCGWREEIKTWGQLGATGAWQKQPIVLLGHDKKSAVRDYFNKAVICRDDFRPGITELSHEALLAKVAENKYAMGYGRYEEGTKLKMLSIKKGDGGFVPLTPENVHNRSYRLQHNLYLYINKPKNQAPKQAVAEFLKIGLSPEGQKAVKAAGYLPLSAELIQRQLNKLK